MIYRAALILIAPLLLFACAREPVALLDQDFSSWPELNAEPITATIPGHGSGIRNIFINDIGTAVTTAMVDGRTVWDYPEGTVILKTVTTPDSTDADDEPVMLLGMIKNDEHPNSLGGWIWLVRDPVTGEERIFDSEYCLTCHADANERRTITERIPTGSPNPNREFRDFVFFPYYAAE